MKKIKLWDKQTERDFFLHSLKIALPNQVFYRLKNQKFVAYYPKDYKGEKTTLQSRNSFIGSYTEKWARELIEPIANKFNAYSLNSVICDELGLTKKSPADIAICKNNKEMQKAEDILLLIEVKMSIVWNWTYNENTGSLECIGDYMSHRGNPGLLRSDSMLKAIGKSINIRVSGFKSSHILIIVLGNTPISISYFQKVDYLKHSGIIQGFYSLNPSPLENETERNLKRTPNNGFYRIDTLSELYEKISNLLQKRQHFFSGMLSKNNLGKIITLANKEITYEKKAETFIKLLHSDKYE